MLPSTYYRPLFNHHRVPHTQGTPNDSSLRRPRPFRPSVNVSHRQPVKICVLPLHIAHLSTLKDFLFHQESTRVSFASNTTVFHSCTSSYPTSTTPRLPLPVTIDLYRLSRSSSLTWDFIRFECALPVVILLVITHRFPPGIVSMHPPLHTRSV